MSDEVSMLYRIASAASASGAVNYKSLCRARRVLDTMRDPTDEMTRAAAAKFGGSQIIAGWTWQAMIDEARRK